MPWLPALFLIIPFTELMILLKVGAEWGFWPTLGLIIFTAMAGYTLFKTQGVKTWLSVQQKLNSGEMPSNELLEGVVILLAGALMITPGLLTDAIGLFCLMPFTRKWALAYLSRRMENKVTFYSATHSSYSYSDMSQSTEEQGRTIEGEFSKTDKSSNK